MCAARSQKRRLSVSEMSSPFRLRGSSSLYAVEESGDVIVRLDETMMRANLQIVSQQYDRAIAGQARLQAERLGLSEMKLPDDLAKRLGNPDVDELVAGEKALFESRGKADAGLKAQL